MSYTAREILSAVNIHGTDYYWENPSYYPLVMPDGNTVTATSASENLYNDSCTGPIYQIIKVGDQHFRKTGLNRSHEGSDWDCGSFEQVFPQTVVVKEWTTVDRA